MTLIKRTEALHLLLKDKWIIKYINGDGGEPFSITLERK